MKPIPCWPASTRSASGIWSRPKSKRSSTTSPARFPCPSTKSKTFQETLEGALAGRAEIREMARSPVMLTALAVLQHNDQKLPEHRVELYESILGWLAAARDAMEGRPSAEKCLGVPAQASALPCRRRLAAAWFRSTSALAAELAAQQLGGGIEQNEDLLEGETQDCGIISSVGTDLRFWHLSFQEFLAAREIASFSDQQQVERIVKSRNLYHPEWREMLRLLGGILKQQGAQKIEGLFRAILDTAGRPANAGSADALRRAAERK